MNRASASDFTQRRVPSALRPAVAIEIGEQPVVGIAVQVDGAAERCLRQHALHLRARPIVSPVPQKLQLALAEQLKSGEIDGFRIVTFVIDVIGPRSHRRDGAHRTRLELAILEDREVDAADAQPREIHADALADRRGIDRVRQVPALRALHHVHVGRREEVAAVRAAAVRRVAPFFTPQVRVSDVVVVRDADRRAILDDLAILEAELDPAGRVLGVVIRLIAREEEQIRILTQQPLHDFRPRALGSRRVASQVGDDDLVLVQRITTDGAVERRLVPMPHPVRHRLRCIPAFDPEVGAPARISNRRAGDFRPGAIALNLQPG